MGQRYSLFNFLPQALPYARHGAVGCKNLRAPARISIPNPAPAYYRSTIWRSSHELSHWIRILTVEHRQCRVETYHCGLPWNSGLMLLITRDEKPLIPWAIWPLLRTSNTSWVSSSLINAQGLPTSAMLCNYISDGAALALYRMQKYLLAGISTNTESKIGFVTRVIGHWKIKFKREKNWDGCCKRRYCASMSGDLMFNIILSLFRTVKILLDHSRIRVGHERVRSRTSPFTWPWFERLGTKSAFRYLHDVVEEFVETGEMAFSTSVDFEHNT